MRIAALSLFASVVLPATALAEDQVRIIMRAFIPNAHPTNPSYVKSVPGQAGKFMIPDPVPGSSKCYSTDNRGFSSTPEASARLTTDLILVAGPNPSVRPAMGDQVHRAGPTYQYDCATGKTLQSSTGTTTKCNVGKPAYADKKVQIVVGCSGANPLAPPAISPKIDYGGTFTYDIEKKTLAYNGDVGAFPAFEAYASLNGGSFAKVYEFAPSAANVWWLYDGGLGVNTRGVSVQPIPLKK